MKNILFHISKLPYCSIAREEEIETILFAASFNYNVTVLFSSKGVLQLSSPQNALGEKKNIAKLIAAFPSFDINTILVCKEDLRKYKLGVKNLTVPVQLISRNKIIKAMELYDLVMSY